MTKWDGISHSPDVGTAGIAFRLWTWAALLRVLKHVVPLATLVRMMHARPSRVTPDVTDDIERYLHTSGRFPGVRREIVSNAVWACIGCSVRRVRHPSCW